MSGEIVPFDPNGARWCSDHMRYECTRHRLDGELCHGFPMIGTDACHMHSREYHAEIDGGQQVITAWNAAGDPDVNVEAVMLGLLQMTWLRARYYAERLRYQVEIDGDTAGNVSDDSPNSSGLIGFRYGAAGKDGRVYVQSEAVRALVELEAAERNRAVKYAEQAHKMGISNRITDLAEQWSNQVAGNLAALLLDLNLSSEQQSRVPELMERHLGSVNIGVTV